MQVHYDEGVAIHIGPKPCVAIRKDADEASAGEGTGQPLNRERPIIPGADTVPNVEGHTHGRAIISERLTTRRGHRPWHVQKLLVREPGGPRPAGSARNACCSGPHREGEEP